MKFVHASLFAVVLSLPALPALAGQGEAEDAVTAVLFDADMQNATYSLRGDGFVDILFGASVPEAEYIAIVEKLKQHPDIPGVLAGRGKGDYCPVK